MVKGRLSLGLEPEHTAVDAANSLPLMFRFVTGFPKYRMDAHTSSARFSVLATLWDTGLMHPMVQYADTLWRW